MRCKRCGGSRIGMDTVNEVKVRYRGCLGWGLWILLAICTCGLILIIPAITNEKTKYKLRTYAYCMDCGKRWRV